MIRISDLSRVAGNRTILEGINLEIRKGEIFTIIGPSGSGKTTLLRLIDHLDLPSKGTILIDGVKTDGTEAALLKLRRRMAMVFQKPTLLNRTVAENVAAGLRFRNIPEGEIQEQVDAALELVGLSGFAGRKAVTLSGGEMQRIAIARAIITKPEILLLDEPTANLDPDNAGIIENLILQINKRFRTTIVFSTHDMVQGQRLAHRIGVIMDGRIAQTGDTIDIFYRPANRAIASFVGIEPVRGAMIEENEECLATISAGNTVFQAVTPIHQGTRVALCIRPDDVTIFLPEEPCPAAGSSARNCLPSTITRIVPLGPFTHIYLISGDVSFSALLTRKSCNELGLSTGSRVTAHVKATAIHVIPDE